MHNHQLELARALHDEGYIVAAVAEDPLHHDHSNGGGGGGGILGLLRRLWRLLFDVERQSGTTAQNHDDDVNNLSHRHETQHSHKDVQTRVEPSSLFQDLLTRQLVDALVDGKWTRLKPWPKPDRTEFNRLLYQVAGNIMND